MGIKVYRLSNGGNNWQDFFGQALGYYLGNRLNEIQGNRAQKAYDAAGYGKTSADPTDDEVSSLMNSELAAQHMDGAGMDARDYINSRKNLWGESQAEIDKNQKALAGLDEKGDDYKKSADYKAQKEEIEKAIALQQANQDIYHKQAEHVRELAKQRGWDLNGYGADDAYNSSRITTAPGEVPTPKVPQGISIQQPLDEKGIINRLAGQMSANGTGNVSMSPEAQNVVNALTNKYQLSYSDLGLDEKALRNAAINDLRRKKELELMQNFDPVKARAAARKAAGAIYSPERKQAFLDEKEREIAAMQDKINKYNTERKVQALAGPLSQVNQTAAALAAIGMLPVDAKSLMDLIKFQPKATVVSNGNMNTVTYGGVRSPEYYAVGASPNNILQYKGTLDTNKSRERIANGANNTRISLANIHKEGKRMELDYDMAKDTFNRVQDAQDAGRDLTKEEKTAYDGANYLRYNSLLAGTPLELDLTINKTIDNKIKSGMSLEDIAKDIENATDMPDELKERTQQILQERMNGG